MTHSGRRIAAKTLAAIAATGLVYLSMRSYFQALEARIVVAVSSALGMGAHVIYERSFHLTLVPHTGLPARIRVDYTVSALSSIMAALFIGLVSPRITMARRIAAVAIAVSVIFVANILRLVLAAAMIVYLGRTWLVLFHDRLGAVFTLIYTLGEVMLILFILLHTPRAQHVDTLAPGRTILDVGGLDVEDEV